MCTYHIPKQLYFVKNKFIFLFLYLGLCPPLCVLTQDPTSFADALRAVGKAPTRWWPKEAKRLYFNLN